MQWRSVTEESKRINMRKQSFGPFFKTLTNKAGAITIRPLHSHPLYTAATGGRFQGGDQSNAVESRHWKKQKN